MTKFVGMAASWGLRAVGLGSAAANSVSFWLWVAAFGFMLVTGALAYGEFQHVQAVQARLQLQQDRAVQAEARQRDLEDQQRRLIAAEAQRQRDLDTANTQITGLQEALSHAQDTTTCANSPALRALRQRMRAPAR